MKELRISSEAATMFSKPSRNHISIIAEQFGAVGLVLLTGAVSLLFDFAGESVSNVNISQLLRRITSGDIYPAMLAAAVAAGIVFAVWSFIRWNRTCFYIDGGYLVVEKNTLMRRVSRVPLGSISTVNLERNLFERVVGTAKIKLDINSAVTANSTDFVFVLMLDKAQAFEKEILQFKDEKSVEQTETNRRLICSFSAFQAFKDVVLGQSVVQILPSVLSIVFAIVSESWSAASVLIILGWLAGMLMQFASACGFKIEKSEDSFYITSGLIKKKNYSFSADKVNAVIVRRPVLARAFGLYRAEVAVVGLGNDKHETPQICLLVKRQELDRILGECAPDFVCSVKPEPSHKMGLAASVSFYLVLFAAVGAALVQVHPVLLPVCAAVGVVLGILSRNGKKLAADDNVFSYSHGIFSLTHASFRYDAVQTVQLRTNPFFRRFGIGRIRLSILGSSAVSVHTTGWFSSDKYEELVRRLGY